MGSGWAIVMGVVLGLIGLIFWLAGVPAMLGTAFGLFVLALAALYVWSDRIRHHQWAERWRVFSDRVFWSRAGQFAARGFGRRLALPEIARHLRAERRERAVALARRFDLVREAAELVAEHRDAESAADFARACGDEPTARRWCTLAYRGHRDRGDWVRAAEAAEGAGLYAEAMTAWGALPDGGGRLRQGRLSERTGHPREALEAYLDAGAAADALRVADRCGLLPELTDGATARENPDLWRLGAGVAARSGAHRRAVDLYRRAGEWRLALAVAREGELDDCVREIEALLTARREAAAEAALRERGYFG